MTDPSSPSSAPPFEPAERLTIYVGESDRAHGKPVHEALVEAAHNQGLAGATAVHGTLGFGAHSRIHTAKILRLAENLPVVVSIIDTPENIDVFMPAVLDLVQEGMITREPLQMLARRK